MSERPPASDDTQPAGQQLDIDAVGAAQNIINDGNPEYVYKHPDAITDKTKAELMAYASKEAEEAVVEAKQKAWRATELAANGREKDREGDLRIRDENIAKAKIQRKKADLQAELTGETYDKLKDI